MNRPASASDICTYLTLRPTFADNRETISVMVFSSPAIPTVCPMASSPSQSISPFFGSSALEADSYHFGTDALGKAAVVLGVGAAYLGYPVMDLVGASAIAVAFLVAAFRMGGKNLQMLGGRLPEARARGRAAPYGPAVIRGERRTQPEGPLLWEPRPRGPLRPRPRRAPPRLGPCPCPFR